MDDGVVVVVVEEDEDVDVVVEEDDVVVVVLDDVDDVDDVLVESLVCDFLAVLLALGLSSGFAVVSAFVLLCFCLRSK